MFCWDSSFTSFFTKYIVSSIKDNTIHLYLACERSMSAILVMTNWSEAKEVWHATSLTLFSSSSQLTSNISSSKPVHFYFLFSPLKSNCPRQKEGEGVPKNDRNRRYRENKEQISTSDTGGEN